MPRGVKTCSTFEQVFISEIVVHDVGLASGQRFPVLMEPEPTPLDKVQPRSVDSLTSAEAPSIAYSYLVQLFIRT